MPRRIARLALALSLLFPVALGAQQVGESINVLPVYKSTPPGMPPGPTDYLRGDLYGQRQNEPSIAVSTLNKDHIVAFYNDFRAVDIPADPMLPGSASTLARAWDGVRGLLARLVGGSDRTRAEPELLAAQEAGIGMSVSYDGGLTWVGGFVPGLPFDTSPASLASPAYRAGMQGMSDPVVVAAPCGRFYLAHLAFTRNQSSQLLVSVLQDQNNDDLRHTIRWVKSTLIEQGNNASFGHFLDKPHIAVAPTGAVSCGAVTEKVYVSYTTFTGNGSGGKFQSKINLATSVDGGGTFTVSKVDDSYTQSQGTAVVANPATGDVHVFWRSFNAPNSVIMSKTGRNGWTKPLDILGAEPLKTIATFDQPSVTTQDVAGNPGLLAFRTNGFPAAAVTPDGGTLLVAWQERVNASGLPDPAGAPKIVLKYSKDGGATWTPRRAIAFDHPASPPGLGFFNPGFPVGPQVMPSLSCGPGSPNRCLLTYYESRPYGSSALSANGWMGGYDRVLDLRAQLIDAPKIGAPAFNPSFQVSRYSYRPLANGELPGEDASYVSPICPPGGPACYPSLNYSGYPHTGGGTTPFMGDYNDAQPVVPYVKDAATGAWRAASTAADAPYGAAFVAAWADNRNVVRPAPADGAEWSQFGNYGPAGMGGSCANPGSRDQSVMAAQVSLGLLVTAPTNYKPFVAPRIEFPMTVWNNTSADRQFQLDVTGSASLSKDDSTLRQGFLTIFAYSSSSVNVYALDGARVGVRVTECTLAACDPIPAGALTGSIAFNAPASAPPAGAPAPAYAPSAIVVNPVPKNPVPKNPVPKNPVPKNPVPADATVYDVVDYSWTVDPSSLGDPATYLALANVDLAYQNDYIFQVFVTKPATAFAADGCDPANVALGTLIANISDPSNPVPKNPVPKNPVPKNPVPKNALPSDVLVQNTTFTLGSSTTPVTSGGTGGLLAAPTPCNATTGAGLIGDCTMAAPRPPNEVTVTVRAYQVTPNPSVVYDPYGERGAPNPPSVAVADYWCDGPNQGCTFVQDGPDLAAPSSAGVTPTTVPAGGAVTFPDAAQVVQNAGNRPALAHQVGFYISSAATASGLPRLANGTIDTTTGAVYTRLLKSVPLAALDPGLSESIDPQALTIPGNIPLPGAGQTGTYYLYAYVDSTRVVSELDEDNNIIQGGPITVVAAGYGFIGLQTPCDPGQLSCTKSGAGAVPLAWQFSRGGVAVDSFANAPRLKFYQGCSTVVTANTPTLLVANPGDLSTGSSGFQYFPAAGTTRPQFTWQYNWERSDPASGATLIGCYQLYIEVPSTGQVLGSSDPGLQPVGPITITLR